MPVIPTFMLRRLYVTGSLQNTSDGFQASIRNTLAPGTIVGLGPVTVSDVVYDAELITVQMYDEQFPAAEITSDAPLRFEMNSTAVLSVRAPSLPAGAHQISIVTMTREAGELNIQAKDTVE